MKLGPDAVVLVLDPDLRTQTRQDLCRVLGRRGEHEPQRMHQAKTSLGESALFGQHGDLADIAGKHSRPADVRLGLAEGLRDRRLQQPFTQPDPQLAGENLDNEAGGCRLAPGQDGGEQRALDRGARGRFHCGERIGQLAQCQAVGRIGLDRAQSEQIGYGGPEVGRSVVRLAERLEGRARHLADRGRDRRPAQSDGALVRLREGSTGQKRCGRPQLIDGQSNQIGGQQRCLFRCPGGPSDALRQLAPATHGGDGIPSTCAVRATATSGLPCRSGGSNGGGH